MLLDLKGIFFFHECWPDEMFKYVYVKKDNSISVGKHVLGYH